MMLYGTMLLSLLCLGFSFHVWRIEQHTLEQWQQEKQHWQEVQQSESYYLNLLKTKFSDFDEVIKNQSVFDTSELDRKENLEDKINATIAIHHSNKYNLALLQEAVGYLDEYLALIKRKQQQLNSIPSFLLARNVPTLRPSDGRLTSIFGLRKHPISRRMKVHEGIDIANSIMTDIVSAASGKVVLSGRMRGYGNTVVIDHGNGFVTLYAHAKELLVNLGEHVGQGSVIAKMGSTGNSTGTHVHYEVRYQDHAINPDVMNQYVAKSL